MPESLDFLPPDGEMARLIRRHDWAATPLGDPAAWSTSLRTIVRFMLSNRCPMLLGWGPEHIQIYNDHSIPALGTRHWQQALGKPMRECWHEVYDVLQPMINTPFNGGPATWTEDLELILRRHGFPEEAHFTIAYSPVPDDTAPRGIGGVMATVHEITAKVITERRVTILSELSTGLATTTTDEQACAQSIAILARHPKDVPFALIYLVDENKHELRLVSSTGVPQESIGPTTFPTGASCTGVAWPLGLALESETTQLRDGIGAELPHIPKGPWECAPDSVAVVPLKSHVPGHAAGALVVGLSACIRPDALYMSFLDLLGAQVATAVANARACDVERRRAEALAEIERASRQKNEFLAVLAHELRNPLAPIRNASTLLARTVRGDANARSIVEVVQRQVSHLSRLVEDLLDVSRITQKRIELNKEALAVADIVRFAVETVEPVMFERDQYLSVQAGDPTLYVHGDVSRLVQSLVNLLMNATKYTERGGRIAVSARREADDAVIEVHDNGVGMGPELLPRLFELFVQADRTRARSQGGLGIGLAVVQRLVDMHGGRVTAASDGPGKGSTFSIWLPLVVAPPSVRKEEPPAFCVRPQRILVVDDNVDAADTLSILLSGDGHQTTTAYNATDALKQIDTFHPETILIDIGLPDMNGYDMAIQIQSMYTANPMKLVALTGYGQANTPPGTGFYAHLIKPVTPDDLRRILGEATA